MRHAPMARIGPHDPGVKDALHALEFAGRAPGEVVLIGVVPERSELELTLTPAVAAALPGVVAEIRAALERFRMPPRPRPH